MSIATITTLGFSIDGGLQAGTALLPTLGYSQDIEQVRAPKYAASVRVRGLYYELMREQYVKEAKASWEILQKRIRQHEKEYQEMVEKAKQTRNAYALLLTEI